MVSQYRYIDLSDLWKRTAGKLCSVHSMYLWERSAGKLSLVHSMYKVDSQAVQLYTWLLVAGTDGFRCKRCDGTIQDADLAGDLLVDVETYGCLKSFSYLGDGGVDLADTARIGNGWMKFRDVFQFLTSRALPLKMKGRVYACCARISMTYGSETRPLLCDFVFKFERAEMQMIRWMCDVSMKDSPYSSVIQFST